MDLAWDGPEKIVQLAMVKLRAAIEAPDQGQDCVWWRLADLVTTGINELA